jgi:hypothetical protein
MERYMEKQAREAKKQADAKEGKWVLIQSTSMHTTPTTFSSSSVTHTYSLIDPSSPSSTLEFFRLFFLSRISYSFAFSWTLCFAWHAFVFLLVYANPSQTEPVTEIFGFKTVFLKSLQRYDVFALPMIPKKLQVVKFRYERKSYPYRNTDRHKFIMKSSSLP